MLGMSFTFVTCGIFSPRVVCHSFCMELFIALILSIYYLYTIHILPIYYLYSIYVISIHYIRPIKLLPIHYLYSILYTIYLLSIYLSVCLSIYLPTYLPTRRGSKAARRKHQQPAAANETTRATRHKPSIASQSAQQHSPPRTGAAQPNSKSKAKDPKRLLVHGHHQVAPGRRKVADIPQSQQRERV